jgi:hypothetical protein
VSTDAPNSRPAALAYDTARSRKNPSRTSGCSTRASIATKSAMRAPLPAMLARVVADSHPFDSVSTSA